MKYKSMLVPAVVLLMDVARAQDGVQVYGVIGGAVRELTNADGAGRSVLTEGSVGWYEQNRWGFRGTELFDDGMDAHFVLEGGFNAGTGTLDNTNGRIWNRIATVGLTGKWGTVDIGHNYTIAHNTARNFDPLLYRFIGLIPIGPSSAGAKADNDIRYTGVAGPVTVRVEYSAGEMAGSAANGALVAGSVLYVNGPLTVGGAYTKRKPNIAAVTASPLYKDNEHWVAGGAYIAGPLRFAGGYMRETQDTVSVDNTIRNTWGGINYNLTQALQLSGALYWTRTRTAGRDGQRDLSLLALTYALSKHTTAFAEADHSGFDGKYTYYLAPPAGVVSQNGVALGLSHRF